MKDLEKEMNRLNILTGYQLGMFPIKEAFDRLFMLRNNKDEKLPTLNAFCEN